MSAPTKKAHCAACSYKGPGRESPARARDDLRAHADAAHGGQMVGHVADDHDGDEGGRDIDHDGDGY